MKLGGEHYGCRVYRAFRTTVKYMGESVRVIKITSPRGFDDYKKSNITTLRKAVKAKKGSKYGMMRQLFKDGKLLSTSVQVCSKADTPSRRIGSYLTMKECLEKAKLGHLVSELPVPKELATPQAEPTTEV